MSMSLVQINRRAGLWRIRTGLLVFTGVLRVIHGRLRGIIGHAAVSGMLAATLRADVVIDIELLLGNVRIRCQLVRMPA